MKLLIIQLSDLHCTDSADLSSTKIQKAVDAILANGRFDKVIGVFSGDLTASAMPNEYKTARDVINAFIYSLRKTADCGFIQILIVPGNHDLYLPKGDRDIKVIEKWVLLDHVDEELKRLSQFFTYAEQHRSVELMRQSSGNAFISSLISRVARKHIVYTPNISHVLVDKLVSGKVLSPSSKKAMLIEQRQREQKKK